MLAGSLNLKHSVKIIHRYCHLQNNAPFVPTTLLKPYKCAVYKAVHGKITELAEIEKGSKFISLSLTGLDKWKS